MTFQQLLQNWPTFFLAGALVASAAGLTVWHLRAKRSLAEAVTDAREHVFRRWQLRRRMQISGMMGLLGIAIAIGQVAMSTRANLEFLLFFWGGVVLLVVWILLLAMADMMATHYHFARIRADFALERARLQVAANKAQSAQRSTLGNGKPHSGAHDALGAEE